MAEQDGLGRMSDRIAEPFLSNLGGRPGQGHGICAHAAAPQGDDGVPSPLFLLPSLKIGGAEIQTLLQIQALHRRGIEASLLLLSAKNDPEMVTALPLSEDRIFIAGIAEDVLCTRFLAALPRRIPGLISFVRAVRPTHILAIMQPGHIAGRLARLGLWGGAPRPELVIWHRNQEQLLLSERTLGIRAFLAVSRLLARAVDGQHWHISEDVRRAVSSSYFTRNDTVLHNAVMPQRSVAQAEARALLRAAGAPEGAFTAIVAARLHEQKGHLVLLEAWARALETAPPDLPSPSLVFAGDGPMRPAIEARITELGLAGSVHLLGRQPHDVVLGLMRTADLVCVPSLREGFGNVAIEALLMGTLVMVSNTGGLPEIVEDGVNGFLVPPGDVSALAARLAGLFAARDGHGIDLAAAREDCIARFSIDCQIDRMLGLMSGNK